MVIRAADGRPYELQDLLPSDTRFKVLVFAGDTSCAEQLSKVNVLASELLGEGGILSGYVPCGLDLFSVFDVLTLSTATLKAVKVDDIPAPMRSHWSKWVNLRNLIMNL